MSIISQALKKAQRERQQTQDDSAWVQSAPSAAAIRPTRRRARWLVLGLLLTLSLAAALHTWLAAPTGRIAMVTQSDPRVADAAPRVPPVRPAANDAKVPDTAARAIVPPPQPSPDPPRAAGIEPVAVVQAPAERQPLVTPAVYTARGNVMYRQGEYREAIDMYEAALALQPTHLKARNNLGNAYLQLAMDDRAIAAFEDILRLDGTYGLAYYNIACVHGRAGNVADAADFLRRALDFEPRAREWAREDGDFVLVREAPEIRRLLEP